jgi:hypothetical protein
VISLDYTIVVLFFGRGEVMEKVSGGADQNNEDGAGQSASKNRNDDTRSKKESSAAQVEDDANMAKNGTIEKDAVEKVERSNDNNVKVTCATRAGDDPCKKATWKSRAIMTTRVNLIVASIKLLTN